MEIQNHLNHIQEELIHLKKENEYLKEQIRKYRYDFLTGLKQRHDFEYEVRHFFKIFPDGFWLYFIDINNLHTINREQGYDKGDEVIRQVANDLEHLFPNSICYRIGGDEFYMICFDQIIEKIKIDNATVIGMHTSAFNSAEDIMSKLDKKMIEKKKKLKRRKTDKKLKKDIR